MLQTISRHPKLIAWLFAILFYLELYILPAAVYASPHSQFVRAEAPSPRVPAYGLVAPPLSVTATMAPAAAANGETAPQHAATGKTAEERFGTGPTQPEMQSFQSVNANNMVDLFTGDFSYNIPLLDVGGYPVNLHYQSGITMEQEASWVGLGWNINPGVITRNMRGLPDDFAGEGDNVVKVASIRPNRTFGISLGANAELLGKTVTQLDDFTRKEDTLIPHFTDGKPSVAGITLGVFHNTYKGWGSEFGVNVNINAGKVASGPLTAGLGLNNNSQDGLNISPSFGVKLQKEDGKVKGNITIGTNYNSRGGIRELMLTGPARTQQNDKKKLGYSFGTSASAYLSFAKPSFTPAISMPYTSSQFSFTAKVGFEKWAYHPNFSIRGYGSVQTIEDDDTLQILPAVGYLYYEKANNVDNVLLDFNREKDVTYREQTPHIALPIYTYDTYTITGEGSGGMFRPYRAEPGYVYDHLMSTKSNSSRVSLDLGFGNIFHGGVDLNMGYSNTHHAPWRKDNALIEAVKFRTADTTYENVYFKNPGEKTTVDEEYLYSIGGDSVMRVALNPDGKQNESHVFATRQFSLFHNARRVEDRPVDVASARKRRDKRTQVISYLTAKEASFAALDKVIRSYHINSFPSVSCNTNYDTFPRGYAFRRPHHISEITVLNSDGRRYIYGVPVYNFKQTDVTMATGTGDTTTGLVSYTPGVHNSVHNNEGDGFYNRESLPAYAHSFLLSGIVSPDYVDVTGDGITEDDLGDAIRFNYSQVYNALNPYRWRAPFDAAKAAYNQGLKTDSRDNRGSYAYGEREVWYLNSIESKTMIATFVLETDSIREDAWGVLDENGGRDALKKLYRLKEINLYTKADYLKNGTNAKPIKTVHFEYNYELCQGNPASTNGKGKLTLKKVWFTYNDNNKGKLNPYEFTYHANNPDYKPQAQDRWGNFKDPSNNPGSAGHQMTNADYPYALQQGVKDWDSAKAAYDAAAWTLSEIKIPSGARIKVSYESDDYAYVQNRRAMQFFSIAGFGSSENATPVARLYDPSSSGTDYKYVFIRVSDTVQTKASLYRKYLEGVKHLFFKLYVKMPGDVWGKGFEVIPCYAEIEDYGLKGDVSEKLIWIRVAGMKVTGNNSPMATAAIQFVRLNLPSKAYPFSEPGHSFDWRTIMNTFASIGNNVMTTINGFANQARKRNLCNDIWLDKTFVRLNNPFYKKLGGGLRVKKVEIFDNWNRMTSQQQQEARYGQEYDYSTTININGQLQRISSGVASYEPSIGGDENPFRVPHNIYIDKPAAAAPTDYVYTEEPFGETFFPAPVVGYSMVRVTSIYKDKKSATGVEETEFYTAKDFPTIVEVTPIDNASKKTYKNRIANVFKFNAKHYVTISQGFKIELNDMHGKIKAQSSYGQNDLSRAIAYTQYYYRLEIDHALFKKLSNEVPVVDAATGMVNPKGKIGLDVEVMIDIREQTSVAASGSAEANIDIVNAVPPIGLGTIIPLPSKETTRFRSIAVTKIVNRYAILDSIVQMTKGSVVTTRDLLYDAETGSVLLNQTNNEFDDPVYNFSYPAHWAYSGMGPAYRNTSAIFRNVEFRQGRMLYRDGITLFPVKQFFESGDELVVIAKDSLDPETSDICDPKHYFYSDQVNIRRLWAIDASKGTEKHEGIYFIDKDGIPYNGVAESVKIMRSGRRNILNAFVGTITSLENPVKEVSGVTRLVVDSSIAVLNASAVRFKDFWKVDSTGYAKDTVGKAYQAPVVRNVEVKPVQYSTIEHITSGGASFRTHVSPDGLPVEYYRYCRGIGCGKNVWVGRKSYLLFNLAGIPLGARVLSANLHLTAHRKYHDLAYGNHSHNENNPHVPSGGPNSNKIIISRINQFPIGGENILKEYYNGNHSYPANRVEFGPSVTPTDFFSPSVTNLVQDMLDARFGPFLPRMQQGLELRLSTDNDGARMCFFSNDLYPIDVPVGTPDDAVFSNRGPVLAISYAVCPDTAQQEFVNGEWRCYSLKDTFVCQPNISDFAVNPYRWGILGNWRADRAFTYYDRRRQSDPSQATNIRTDGVIRNFMPYWNFGNTLTATEDSSRWVWNSELVLFNNKGNETENRDPLNRHNAAQFGYNKSLPVAVAQNSKHRQMLFDGFEDYFYRTDTCKRCQDNRYINLLTVNGTLTDTVSHSGLYSYRVNGNSSSLVTVPVVTALQDDTSAIRLSVKVDSTLIIKDSVDGKGWGLKGTYRRVHTWPWEDEVCLERVDPEINFVWGESAPYPGCPTNAFEITWEGKLQPRYTDTYWFHTISDDGVVIYLDDQLVHYVATPRPVGGEKEEVSMPLRLEAGHLYNIRIVYTEYKGPAHLKLWWSGHRQEKEIIPSQFLYPPEITEQDTVGSFNRDSFWCVVVKPPKGNHLTNEKFSPIAGTKIVVSAWVKEGDVCAGTQYNNARLQLAFNGGSAGTFNLTPSGFIIEGWQRIEDTLTIPPGATSMAINLQATSSTPVYFDDIRIHPFNSNMKSFVYNPVNLRLMAELDENNHAAFYEYDDDGTLIRVKKETERGIKTINETRTALSKITE